MNLVSRWRLAASNNLTTRAYFGVKDYKTVHIVKCRPEIILLLNYEENIWDSGGIGSFILNSALDGSEQSPSCSGRFNTGKTLGSHKNGD